MESIEIMIYVLRLHAVFIGVQCDGKLKRVRYASRLFNCSKNGFAQLKTTRVAPTNVAIRTFSARTAFGAVLPQLNGRQPASHVNARVRARARLSVGAPRWRLAKSRGTADHRGRLGFPRPRGLCGGRGRHRTGPRDVCGTRPCCASTTSTTSCRVPSRDARQVCCCPTWTRRLRPAQAAVCSR